MMSKTKFLPPSSSHTLALPVSPAVSHKENTWGSPLPSRLLNEEFNRPLVEQSSQATLRITPNATHPCHHRTAFQKDMPIRRVCVCVCVCARAYSSNIFHYLPAHSSIHPHHRSCRYVSVILGWRADCVNSLYESAMTSLPAESYAVKKWPSAPTPP